MTLADLVEETAEEIDTLRAMLDPHELSVDEVALEQRLQLLPQLRDASAGEDNLCPCFRLHLAVSLSLSFLSIYIAW